jgi:hypothetical protein
MSSGRCWKEDVGNASPQTGNPDRQKQYPCKKPFDESAVTVRRGRKHERHHKQEGGKIPQHEAYCFADHPDSCSLFVFSPISTCQQNSGELLLVRWPLTFRRGGLFDFCRPAKE